MRSAAPVSQPTRKRAGVAPEPADEIQPRVHEKAGDLAPAQDLADDRRQLRLVAQPAPGRRSAVGIFDPGPDRAERPILAEGFEKLSRKALEAGVGVEKKKVPARGPGRGAVARGGEPRVHRRDPNGDTRVRRDRRERPVLGRVVFDHGLPGDSIEKPADRRETRPDRVRGSMRDDDHGNRRRQGLSQGRFFAPRRSGCGRRGGGEEEKRAGRGPRRHRNSARSRETRS